MYDPDHNAPPFNPIPPIVWALAGVIAAFEAAFQLGARGLVGGPEAIAWRLAALQTFGFYDAMWEYMLQSGSWPIEGLWRFVSYALVHASFSHALFSCVLILALGNFTARVFRPIALLIVFLLSLAGGAVIYGLTSNGGTLYGAYPGAYGLIGLYTWCLWAMAEKLGNNPWRAFQLIAVLAVLQFVFVLIGGRWDSLVAEFTGFVIGFGLAAPAAPGGLARMRARLQGR